MAKADSNKSGRNKSPAAKTKSAKSGAVNKQANSKQEKNKALGVNAQIRHNETVIHELSSERTVETRASQSGLLQAIEPSSTQFQQAQQQLEQSLGPRSQFFVRSQTIEAQSLAKLESRYSLVLPEDYREFLLKHGLGQLAPLAYRSLSFIDPEQLLNAPFSQWIRAHDSKFLPILQCDTGDLMVLALQSAAFKSAQQNDPDKSATAVYWLSAFQFYQATDNEIDGPENWRTIADSFADWMTKFSNAAGDYFWLQSH